jgi:hypothetical protein
MCDTKVAQIFGIIGALLLVFAITVVAFLPQFIMIGMIDVDCEFISGNVSESNTVYYDIIFSHSGEEVGHVRIYSPKENDKLHALDWRQKAEKFHGDSIDCKLDEHNYRVCNQHYWCYFSNLIKYNTVIEAVLQAVLVMASLLGFVGAHDCIGYILYSRERDYSRV